MMPAGLKINVAPARVVKDSFSYLGSSVYKVNFRSAV